MRHYKQVEYGFYAPDEVVAVCAQPHKGGKALDIGCGLGSDTVYAAELGYHVDAVDSKLATTMSEEENPHDVLTKAAQYATQYNLPIRTHCERIEQYIGRVEASYYDLVIANYVLHHHSIDGYLLYPAIMPEIIRVLKPGGRLICAMLKSMKEIRCGYREVLSRPLGTMISDGELRSLWKGALHPVFYVPEELTALDPNGRPTRFQHIFWKLVADKK